MEIKLPLKRKAPLFVLVLVIIPLLTVSLFFYIRSREVLMKTISVNNTSFTLSAARGIRDQVLSFRNILESAVRSVLMAETITEKKDILIGLKEGFISIESLAILDSKGEEIVRSDDKALQDRSENPEFYIAKEGGFYFSWFKYNEEQGLSSIILSVPILKENKFEGVLVAEIFLYEVWNQAMIASLSPNDNCYIFTQKGQLVAEITAANDKFRSPDLEKIALDSALGGKLFTKEQKTEIGSMLVIASPVPALGWELVIFRPTAEIYEPVTKTRNEVIIISSLSLIFVSIAAFLFSRRVVNPIGKLYEGARIIGRGDLEHRVEIKTGDEIEDLAEEFNRMVESLKKSQRALEEAKTSLEIRVKSRTKELEELTEGLEEKVKERTKELQKRISELERFRRVTIARELKMIELKKDIKRLKKEFKEYKKEE